MDTAVHKFILVVVFVAAIVPAGCSAPLDPQLLSESPDPSSDDPVVIEDELVLLAKAGTDTDEITELLTEHGATLIRSLSDDNLYLIGVDPAERDATRTALALSALVEDVTENLEYRVTETPDDSRYPRQWYLEAIGAPAAWDISTGDEEVIVAVLDTGVETGHPDLLANRLDGWNTHNNNTDADDNHGHGTRVAGIIAAAGNNGNGIASLAWESKILPVRIADDNGLSTSFNITAGMRWAVANGARVINISFAPLYWDTLVAREARLTRLAGALVVIASGNNGKASRASGSDEILFVGATDDDDRVADFSNAGPYLDLVAPGVEIYTTIRNGRYGPVSGTSFAAPIVSGVAALIFSVNPSLRPVTVEEILLEAAVDLGTRGRDDTYGHGRVDAAAALRLARDVRAATDTVVPIVAITSPSNGATLRSRTEVVVRATDRGGVADVLLWVDDVALGSDPLSPHEFLLNPTRYASGTHTLTAVAVDEHGNASEPDVIEVIISGRSDATAPSIEITQPLDSATVSGVVTIIADASDDRALREYEVLVDQRVIATTPLNDTEPDARIAYNWDTAPSTVSSGTHTVAIRVTDTSGNTATDSVRVSVVKLQ
jgi:hypothetical protein